MYSIGPTSPIFNTYIGYLVAFQPSTKKYLKTIRRSRTHHITKQKQESTEANKIAAAWRGGMGEPIAKTHDEHRMTSLQAGNEDFLEGILVSRARGKTFTSF